MGDYWLCGWRVRSELPLPELIAWQGDDRPPELTITIGPVPDTLENAEPAGPFVMVGADGTVRFEVKAVGAFLVRNGREVTVEPRLAPDAPDLGLFLLGSVFGILCHQRGLLPLHASCVEMDGKAIAVAGGSGFGKSTLAAMLVGEGHRLIADDVTVLRLEADGPPMVLPSFPRQKLWADTLDHLGLAPGRRVRQSEAMEKFEFRSEGRFPTDPLPLGAVFHLGEKRLGHDPALRRLTGVGAAEALRATVYRQGVAFRLGLQNRLFMDCARLANRVPQWRLLRPQGLTRMKELVDHLAALPGLAP